ncbi:MAG: glycosyltransferase family 9 protein [Vicinamibacterales bacterium]
MSVSDRLRLLGGYVRRDTIVLRRLSRALGDNLLLTAVAREIRRARPGRRIIVETTLPEIFDHNPNVDWAVDARWMGVPGVSRPRYRIEPGAPADHILDQLFEQVGLPRGKTERRPEMYFSPAELSVFADAFPAGAVVVCPVGKQSHASDRKEWGFDRFQGVVDARSDLRWIQVGSPTDPLLRGAADHRGLRVRMTAGLLRRAKLFLGLEGGLMHLARAVDTPAVVVYGGALHPAVSGYAQQVALWRRPACSPCFSSHDPMSPCPHARGCLTSISVDDVLEAVASVIDRESGIDRTRRP